MNTLTKYLSKIVFGFVLLGIGGASVYGWLRFEERLNRAKNYEHLEARLSYYEQAERISAYYFTLGEKINVSVVRKTLQEIDRNLPQYFPEGPYNRKDFIALAMAESGFDQYLVGGYKEYGIFQIMPDMAKLLGVKKNHFDIAVNTDMAFRVLRDKYAARPDYKHAIIAYNGYVIKKDGKLYDAYWKRFVRFRKALDDIFPDTPTN